MTYKDRNTKLREIEEEHLPSSRAQCSQFLYNGKCIHSSLINNYVPIYHARSYFSKRMLLCSLLCLLCEIDKMAHTNAREPDIDIEA